MTRLVRDARIQRVAGVEVATSIWVAQEVRLQLASVIGARSKHTVGLSYRCILHLQGRCDS